MALPTRGPGPHDRLGPITCAHGAAALGTPAGRNDGTSPWSPPVPAQAGTPKGTAAATRRPRAPHPHTRTPPAVESHSMHNVHYQIQLPNGLQVVAEHLPAVRSAAFQFIVPAGAVTDPDGKEGAATVLE